MKYAVETATGARKSVPDDYEAQLGEKIVEVMDAPAVAVEVTAAPEPEPEEEAEEEEEEEEEDEDE